MKDFEPNKKPNKMGGKLSFGPGTLNNHFLMDVW